MRTNVTFVFIAATILTIFAAGSVLMGIISTGSAAINEEVSNTAQRYSTIFLGTTLFLAVLATLVTLLLGSKRTPF